MRPHAYVRSLVFLGLAVFALVAPPRALWSQEAIASQLEAELDDPETAGVERLELRLRHIRALLSSHLPSALIACETGRAEAKEQGRDDYLALMMAIEARAQIKVEGATVATDRMNHAREIFPEDAPAELRGHFAVVETRFHHFLDQHGLAAERLSVALELAEASGSKQLMADCLLELHDLLYMTGTGHEPADDLTRAEALLAELGDQRGLLRVRLRWADVWLMQGHEPRAMQALNEVVEQATAIGDRVMLMQACARLSSIALNQDEKAKSLELDLSNVDTALEMEDDELLSWALDSVAWTHLLSGRPDEAAPYVEEALEIATRIERPALLIAALESACELANARVDADALLGYYQRLDAEYDSGVSATGLPDADQILRGLRSARRVHHEEERMRAAELRHAEEDRQRRASTYRWIAAGVALLLATTVALLFFVGKRRAERMHAQLREQTAIAQRTEEARQRLERHVNQLERIDGLGLLAAGIAHDFNNILCGILGHAEVLRDELPKRRREMADTILKEAGRAADLCNRMLDYGKPSPADPETVDLRDIVSNAQVLIEVGGDKSVSLECSLDEQPVNALVDRSGIEQVLINLVLNARDPSVGATRLAVRVRSCAELPNAGDEGVWFGHPEVANRYAVLEVEDDGHGMAEDRVRRIFDPFFTTKFAGRGIGLSASRGIVAGHRGAFRVVSSPGRGTTFSAFFPSVESTAERRTAAAAASVTELPAAAPSSGCVLVVDDEKAILTFVTRALEGVGYQVLTAASAREALGLLYEDPTRIDILLVDLTMPGMDGIELLAEVRRGGFAQPVVVMSGHGQDFMDDRLADLDVASTLRKPFRVSELRERLSDANVMT